ncbi:hypothetical protein Dfri01_21370 [Dyadobacter frigoris]|nr:hypothetical protein Dfri01_21370 [Dyadobacter frigoris]
MKNNKFPANVGIKVMTFEGCEHHVKQEVQKLKGIHQIEVSYKVVETN